VTELSDLWASRQDLQQHALSLVDEEVCTNIIYGLTLTRHIIYIQLNLQDLWASKQDLQQHAMQLAEEEACIYSVYTAPFTQGPLGIQARPAAARPAARRRGGVQILYINSSIYIYKQLHIHIVHNHAHLI